MLREREIASPAAIISPLFPLRPFPNPEQDVQPEDFLESGAAIQYTMSGFQVDFQAKYCYATQLGILEV